VFNFVRHDVFIPPVLLWWWGSKQESRWQSPVEEVFSQHPAQYLRLDATGYAYPRVVNPEPALVRTPV
jgi:hypothetical protein